VCANQIQSRTSSQVFHNDPQLHAAHEARLVLGNIGAFAGAQQVDLGLDIGELVGALFKINLDAKMSKSRRGLFVRDDSYHFDGDCLSGGCLDSLVHLSKAPA
jgi:hypothetical protein